MTPAQIGKVWTVISLVLLYYAFNSWIVTQGGHEIFSVSLISSDRIPAAMIAIPICAILLAVTSTIGRAYAKRAGPRWHDRIPVVGFEAIDTASAEGRIYQGAIASFFAIIPAVAMVHFWNLFSRATVITTEHPPRTASSVWDWSAFTSWSDPARICSGYSESPTVTCTGNASVLPGLEPTIFAALTALAILAMALHALALFRPDLTGATRQG